MNLTWEISVAAGALHAARALLTGRTLVDQQLAAAIRAPTEALAAAAAASGCVEETVWRHLLPLAAKLEISSFKTAGSPTPAQVSAARELAARVLEQIRAEVSPSAIDRLGLALAGLLAAFVAAQPRLANELPLRREPLRLQWEARGPGLLVGVRGLTSVDWLVPAATVLLVPPVLGGAGQAHPIYNVVTFEAMLANPIAQLPEVLRLGWLLAQLNPALADPAPESVWNARSHAAPWALLPVVLAAAEEVELARADRAHVQLAAAEWLKDQAAADPVWRWWESRERRTPGLAGGIG